MVHTTAYPPPPPSLVGFGPVIQLIASKVQHKCTAKVYYVHSCSCTNQFSGVGDIDRYSPRLSALSEEGPSTCLLLTTVDSFLQCTMYVSILICYLFMYF